VEMYRDKKVPFDRRVKNNKAFARCRWNGKIRRGETVTHPSGDSEPLAGKTTTVSFCIAAKKRGGGTMGRTPRREKGG